jgi:hypothetical protein
LCFERKMRHNTVHMTDEVSWLQQWYSTQCDGEWEHGPGITIETIDNPGWSVTICIESTEMESVPFEPVKTETNEANWVQCRVAEREKGENYRRFEGHGGASNLSDIIGIFRTWVDTKR